MNKRSVPHSNHYCPQALYLYGTYKEDGTPNFGLFCWFSYCWDSELRIMACVGGEKLTKDRIRAGKVFSANLVTESLLPLADYLGNTEGYTPGKMDIPLETDRGSVLPVPILKDSPWVYELEVVQSIPLDDSELFICKIHNVLAAEELLDEGKTVDERMSYAAPVIGTGAGRYYSVNPDGLGSWGEWKDHFKK